MQQVGHKSSFAAAAVLEPRHLPMVARSTGRHAVVTLGHIWVLHRKLLVRIIVAVICAFLFGAAIHARSELARAAMVAGDVLSGRLAAYGLAVQEISISGQALTADSKVVEALAVGDNTSILSYDAEAARARLDALPAVASATVRKVYPGKLIVHITEKKPIARWRVDGVTFLIDAQGEQIANASAADDRLPLVIGDGAETGAKAIITTLNKYPALSKDLIALSRIGDRRWDLIYKTGLRVQLPENGVAGALKRLADYQAQYSLLDRDVELIDLRVAGMVAVRPIKRDKDGKPIDTGTSNK